MTVVSHRNIRFQLVNETASSCLKVAPKIVIRVFLFSGFLAWGMLFLPVTPAVNRANYTK